MQCGLCDKVVTVPEDRRVKNRLQFFKKNHYNKYVAGAVVFRIRIILIRVLGSDCWKKNYPVSVCDPALDPYILYIYFF